MRRPARPLLLFAMSMLLAACAGRMSGGAPDTPEAAVAALLDADRDFSRASASTDAVSGIARMFHENVFLNARGAMHRGRAAATEALRATPDAATSRAEWAPVRGGISADGQHGFTFGYMTVTKADGNTQPLKYLSYWTRTPDGWRVLAYRRVLRPAGDVALAPWPPALPDRMVAPSTDSAVIRAHAEGVADAERAFSAEAQVIGLGPAFAKHGSDDAMNMGGPANADFVRGAQAIGAAVGAGVTPDDRVVWGPEHAFAASSGDLGVSIGTIEVSRKSAGDAGPVQRIPFFTVWRRVGGVWRYVAE